MKEVFLSFALAMMAVELTEFHENKLKGEKEGEREMKER